MTPIAEINSGWFPLVVAAVEVFQIYSWEQIPGMSRGDNGICEQ